MTPWSQSRIGLIGSKQLRFSDCELCAGVYVVIIIAGMCFILDVRFPTVVSGRIGLLVGCLFATIVNMQQAEATLGQSEDVTPRHDPHHLDRLHPG